MKPRIWFIKNMTHEAAGLFSSFAEQEKIPYAIADLHKGDPFPEVGPGQALVILGGPDSANDVTPKILSELAALRKCMQEGIPCLGICLGLQLLVKAAGGTVFRNSIKEIGFREPSGDWFEITKTSLGEQDPLLAGIPERFKVFQLHGETVGTVPPMACLSRGRTCENQVVRVRDRVYGVQGHVELSERMFEDWLAADGDLHRMNHEDLRRDFREARTELEQSSEILFKNFLRISDGLIV